MNDKYYYLAGPMTGIPQCNFPTFMSASSVLRSLGYNIVSPAELDDEEIFSESIQSSNGVTSAPWKDLLARDIKIVADENCLGIILLPGWKDSRGAAVETWVASVLDKDLFRLRQEGDCFSLEWVDRDSEVNTEVAGTLPDLEEIHALHS